MKNLDHFQSLQLREEGGDKGGEGKKEWQIKSGFGHLGGIYFLHSLKKANFTRIVPVSSYLHKQKDRRRNAYSKCGISEDM